ncbi:MAG: hypothetical protein JWO67_3952 [Streptosporangiaceae bacterium]|jgi:hypothetical protein|nr:hypothetical protein [Streptosporangiaceae bacterium]
MEALTILTLGVICLAAAAVGGGLKIYKAEFPHIASVRRQALLAAVGALAVGVALVLLFVTKTGGGRGDDQAASRTGETKVSPSGRLGSTSPVAETPGNVFWRGEREFEGTATAYDLDAIPGSPEGNDELSYDAATRKLGMSYSSDSAAWPGPGTPTSADCRRRVKTHRQQDIQVRPETMACLITDQNRVAFIRVKAFATRDGHEAAVAEVTIWNPR